MRVRVNLPDGDYEVFEAASVLLGEERRGFAVETCEDGASLQLGACSGHRIAVERGVGGVVVVRPAPRNSCKQCGREVRRGGCLECAPPLEREVSEEAREYAGEVFARIVRMPALLEDPLRLGDIELLTLAIAVAFDDGGVR